MYVLEGEIQFILKNGKTVILNAGEYFVLQKKGFGINAPSRSSRQLEEIYEKVL